MFCSAESGYIVRCIYRSSLLSYQNSAPYDNWVPQLRPLEPGSKPGDVELCMVVKAADMYLRDFSHGHEHTYEEWRNRNRVSLTLTINRKNDGPLKGRRSETFRPPLAHFCINASAKKHTSIGQPYRYH